MNLKLHLSLLLVLLNRKTCIKDDLPIGEGMPLNSHFFFASSSTSDIELYKKRPLPIIPHEPEVEIYQPKERRLRRDESKHRKPKRRQKEKHSKRESEQYIEMEHLAGVVENVPRLSQNLLPQDDPTKKIPVRFSALPPLVQTRIVTSTPRQAFEETEDRNERDKDKLETRLPQTNTRELNRYKRLYKETSLKSLSDKSDEDLYSKASVERMRNKIRQREKIRQDMREKERQKDKELKRQRGIEPTPGKGHLYDTDEVILRYLFLRRKKKMRKDRWIHNRVGTSTSMENSEGDAETDSEEKRKEEEHLKKKLDRLRKKKTRKVRKDVHEVLVSGRAPRAVAHDALRESNWVTTEIPGVQLVTIRPRDLENDYSQPHPGTSVPVYTQQPVVQQVMPHQSQNAYIQDLLNRGYPIISPLTEPATQPADYLSSPRESSFVVAEDELDQSGNLYQPIGPDFYVPQHEAIIIDDMSPRSAENLYEEPLFTPASLPQSHITRPQGVPPSTPQNIYVRSPFPSDILRPHPQMTSSAGSGRPSSSRPNTQGGRSTRPSSARSSPSTTYIRREPRPYEEPTGYPKSEVSSVDFTPRSYTRPTSATSTQRSLGTSPRYMGTSRTNMEPRDPYIQARTMLDSARKQVDRFEREKSRDEPDGISNGHPKPRGVRVSRLTSQPKTPNKATQDQLAAMEKAELEAQLLVSRALARARTNKIS
ncbi:hypothetical protein QZH41_012144 [Actinostola sp. cb2023]|nr:hypothetical protein QZH41_012144 [Actinostola sp. cb2023]